MPLNHLFADRQAYTRSRMLFLAVQTLKYLEDTLGKLGIDPDSVVADRKHPLITAFHRGNMDLRRLLTSVFDPVTDQILKYRSEL